MSVFKVCLAWACLAGAVNLMAAEPAAPAKSEETAKAEQPAAETTAPAEVPAGQKLVIGDHYRIRVQRDGDHEIVNGTLVKVTERWIVLHHVAEGRAEQGVPVLRDFPGLNKVFKNVGVGRTDESVWVPRDIAKVEARTLREEKTEVKVPHGAAPMAFGAGMVRLADRDRWGKNGQLEAISDDGVMFKSTELIETRKPVPVIGQLPLLGNLFETTEYEPREHRASYTPDKILCVRVNNNVHIVSGE